MANTLQRIHYLEMQMCSQNPDPALRAELDRLRQYNHAAERKTPDE